MANNHSSYEKHAAGSTRHAVVIRNEIAVRFVRIQVRLLRAAFRVLPAACCLLSGT